MDSKNESDNWLDWSKVETFHLCPQKYAYRYEEDLVGGSKETYVSSTGEETSVVYSYDSSLAFGQALHAALACIYEGTAFADATCPCEDTCDFCDRLYETKGPCIGFYRGRRIHKCIAQFLLYYPWDPDPVTDNRNQRTRERGVQLIHAYLTKWKREAFKVEAVEQEFEIPFYEQHGRCIQCDHLWDSHELAGCIVYECKCPKYKAKLSFVYRGRIDLLLRRNGEPIQPKDHKSASAFGMNWEGQFRLHGQFTGYVEAVREITGENTTGAWANGIKTTGPIGEDSFKRLETNRTPEDLDRWKEEILEVWSLIQQYRLRRFWPRHAPFSCFAYNRRCAYYTLCASGSREAEDIKRSDYVKIPWHPGGEV